MVCPKNISINALHKGGDDDDDDDNNNNNNIVNKNNNLWKTPRPHFALQNYNGHRKVCLLSL
jgi:hypothetical protein